MGMKMVDCQAARPKAIAPGIDRIEGFFPPSFLALQTTREGGKSLGPYASFNLATHVGDDPVHVAANRARLAKHLPAQPLWLCQVHGVAIAECSGDEPPQADAGIVQGKQSVAVVMTADCLPLLVARPATGQCAAIHAGWRGLAAGVIEATLDRMAACAAPAAGRDGDAWFIWLGPAIGPKAFEVGQEVVDAFTASDIGASAAFFSLDLPKATGTSSVATHKWLGDLSMLATRRIEHWCRSFRGAATLFLARSNECVHTDEQRYFSFRRDKVCGRMASLICNLY